MPKIEIKWFLEELTSKEAKSFRQEKGDHTVITPPNSSGSESESSNNSTTSSDDLDDATTDLIESLASDAPKSVDYDATETMTPENMNKQETSTPSRPMMLSEFASHLASGIRGKTETTTPPLPDFPTPHPNVFATPPDETFPFMVTAAKDFIRRYLSPEQWRKLRILLKTIREVGGSRVDIHRAATTYISKVISKTEMAEITGRKSELFRTFNRRYFDNARRN